MEKIHTIYVKELTDIQEVFKENSKLPMWLKKCILLIKKIFCVVTIKENGVCVLPYRELTHFLKIKLLLLKKVFTRIDMQVVLSNYLEGIEEVKRMLNSSKISFIEGERIANYFLPEVLEYIAKMTKEEMQKQEITVLVEKKTGDIEKIIVELATKVKRIQIVTPNIAQFERLENELEMKFGIACTINNNKRKSLAKSKIIINFNVPKDEVNQFHINPYAIIIDINQKIKIESKSFCGIHIYDYQMEVDIPNVDANIFEIKKQYEAKFIGNSYETIRNVIREENAKIVNLIGRKGMICKEEYKRISEKQR